MRAVVVRRPGEHSVEDVDDPGTRPGEVLIRIEAASLCYRDLLQLRGFYPGMRYPVILGHEASGVVEGSRDPRFEPGDRVVPMVYGPDGTCEFCMRGEESLCRNKVRYGETADGFFAERAAAVGNGLVRVPDGVKHEQAAAVPCVLAMVYKGLRRASASQGEWALVTGAGGGVGSNAVALLRALGLRTIAVTGSEDKARVLRELGADEVLVGKSFEADVKRLTGGGADVAIEAVGTPTMGETVRSMRPGGRVVVIGNVDPSSSYDLKLGYAIVKDIELIFNIASDRADVYRVLRLIEGGALRPVLRSTYSLQEFGDALDELAAGRGIGKIILRP